MHFQQGCGGCTWQHIAYPEQLRRKTALVDRLVRAAVPRAPAARPMLPSTPLDNPWGYRHKVHFVFSAHGRSGPRLGHYLRGSRRVLPVHECPVHEPRGNALAFAFGDAFARQLRGPAAAAVRSIAIRVGAQTGEIAATLVVATMKDRAVREASRRALEWAPEPPTSFHVNIHPRDDGFIFGEETRRISGPARIREVVAGASFVISPTAFFQTNMAAAEILARLVLEAVPEGATVLDLYAGAGLFALPLAARGHTVTAVEENRAAVADGEASQRLNRIPPDRCRFVAKSVETALRQARPVDVVVLDPPRDGCAPGVIDGIFGALQPSRAIYVSCNPEALAPDLAAAVRHGYTIAWLQPVDMFPHTAHVETVVMLTR